LVSIILLTCKFRSLVWKNGNTTIYLRSLPTVVVANLLLSSKGTAWTKARLY
jgi:hypothetical protein